jgi:hypothetical protein
MQSLDLSMLFFIHIIPIQWYKLVRYESFCMEVCIGNALDLSMLLDMTFNALIAS